MGVVKQLKTTQDTSGMKLYRKYEVYAGSVEQFLDKYYKTDRFRGRGADYAAVLIASKQRELDTVGFALISHHDSKTGEPVSYYGRTK